MVPYVSRKGSHPHKLVVQAFLKRPPACLIGATSPIAYR
jgi:hypothetical protein